MTYLLFELFATLCLRCVDIQRGGKRCYKNTSSQGFRLVLEEVWMLHRGGCGVGLLSVLLPLSRTRSQPQFGTHLSIIFLKGVKELLEPAVGVSLCARRFSFSLSSSFTLSNISGTADLRRFSGVCNTSQIHNTKSPQPPPCLPVSMQKAKASQGT